jgi:hypothetical protein
MTFNFNKKNLLIIMLLIIVILSTIVYVNMQNIKETFVSSNRVDTTNIILDGTDSSYNYYKLNTSASKYTFKNIEYTSNIANYLTYVTSISNDIFETGISNTARTYFRDKGAFVGYNTDNSNVSLYTIKPTANIELTGINRTTGTQREKSVQMLLIENSGNLYDLCDNKLSGVMLHVNNVPIIKDGKFETRVTPTVAPTVVAGAPATATTGDINFNGIYGGMPGFSNSLLGLSNELILYMMQNGGFGTSYVPPIYNNFETAMNLASNPIVNPVNSMNPLEYAQTLFGPQVTPIMSKNSILNSSIDSAQVNEGTNDSNKDNTKSNSNTSVRDMFKFDNDGNLLSQNIGSKSSDSSTSSINKNSSSINQDSNLSQGKCPPCPGPQRCPESNFECKKVPNYEQGIDNAFLPRPVLADFSTFGM